MMSMVQTLPNVRSYQPLLVITTFFSLAHQVVAKHYSQRLSLLYCLPRQKKNYLPLQSSTNSLIVRVKILFALFVLHITVVPVAQLLVVATLLFQVKYLYHIVAFFFSMSSQNSLIKYLNHFVSPLKTTKSPSLGQKKKLPSPQILSSSLP